MLFSVVTYSSAGESVTVGVEYVVAAILGFLAPFAGVDFFITDLNCFTQSSFVQVLSEVLLSFDREKGPVLSR